MEVQAEVIQNGYAVNTKNTLTAKLKEWKLGNFAFRLKLEQPLILILNHIHIHNTTTPREGS